MLWIVGPADHAATSCTSSGRSIITPLSKRAPARTSATRCGPLTARQRCWAEASSLKRHRQPLGLGAGPLGHPGPEPDRGEGRLDRVAGLEVLPVLDREVEEAQQLLGVVADLGHRLGPLDAVVAGERLDGTAGLVVVGRVADRRARWRSCGPSRADGAWRGTHRAAPPTAPARRRPPSPSARACRACAGRVAARPTTGSTRAPRRRRRPAPWCRRPARPRSPGSTTWPAPAARGSARRRPSSTRSPARPGHAGQTPGSRPARRRPAA